MTDKSIYDLGLHESVSVNNGTDSVTRVPGGWIYERWRYVGNDNYEPFSTAFVPFNTEFLRVSATKQEKPVRIVKKRKKTRAPRTREEM